jgi:hypothetical protein
MADVHLFLTQIEASFFSKGSEKLREGKIENVTRTKSRVKFKWK